MILISGKEFRGGIMNGQDQNEERWDGEWIRFGWNPVVPLLRKGFVVDKPVVSARIKATALGVFELWMNGVRVSDEMLMPGWTDYRTRLYYREYDLKGLLRDGENVLGAIVAPGWYAGYIGPFEDKGYYGQEGYFSCGLVLEYEDGSSETVKTDSTWQGHAGPIRSADLLMGETYDARDEQADWSMPGSMADLSGEIFTPPGQWGPVVSRDEPVEVPIAPYPGEPVRMVEELPAQKVTEPEPGMFVFDVGQNMVGVVRLKVDVPAGTEIVLRHGEMLNNDGTLYTENLRAAKATDRYIAKGGGEEWQPRFTFHGFRYVEVTGLPAKPKPDAITGMVMMSGLRETARFECSNEKVNQLFSNIRWGFRGNYLEVPTDCPQRDERLGWTGDAQMFVRSASYLADIRPFYKKWLVDLHDAQHENGGYPDTAPFLGRLGHARAAWGDAGIVCPYVLWQAYGDTEFIRSWWAEMNKYMELICSENNLHNGPNAFSYGDWLHFNSETPVRLVGLAYRAYNARLMAEMAAAIGEDADEFRFLRLADEGRALFRKALFDGDAIAVKTQTACAMAIAMELLEGDDLDKAKQCLVEEIEARDGYLTTGFVGTGYICPALSKIGRGDLAVQLLLNEGHPSWLYEVNNGATTIWERWNSWTAEDGFGDVGMNSFNHYAFGSVCEWMFESLAGIRPAKPGFQTLEVEPCLTDRFDYVKASYDSVHGRISIHWKKTAGGFEVELDSPVPAHIRLPSLTKTLAPGRHVFGVPASPEPALA